MKFLILCTWLSLITLNSASADETQLVCRGDSVNTFESQNIKEKSVISLTINVDESWVLFHNSWGCYLDYGKKNVFQS